MLSHCSVFQCYTEGLLWTVREGHKFISFCYMSPLIKKKVIIVIIIIFVIAIVVNKVQTFGNVSCFT